MNFSILHSKTEDTRAWRRSGRRFFNLRRRFALPAVLTALLIAVAVIPAQVYAGAIVPLDAPSAAVTLSYQHDASGLVIAPKEMSVSAGLSEQYGYTDSYNGTEVTALDAIVAAHITVYGADKATVNAKMGFSGGFVNNFMGDGAGNMAYYVNGAMPSVGASDTVLKSGDLVQLYSYQDTTNWTDLYAWFEQGGAKVSSLTAKAGESISLTVMGMGWGNPAPVNGAGVVVAAPVSGTDKADFGAPLAVTGTDGSVAVSFGNPGAYLLYAINANGASPLMSSPLMVTVQPPQVAGIRAAKTTYYVVKGKSLTIKYAYDLEPGQTAQPKFTWTSSNDKVVSVTQSGAVKGLKSGKSAKITITSDSGKTKTFTVKVVSAAVKATKVSVSNPPKTMAAGTTAALKVKVSPSNATGGAATFSSNKNSVVTVDKAGMVKAVAKGTAKVTVKQGGQKTVITIKVK